MRSLRANLLTNRYFLHAHHHGGADDRYAPAQKNPRAGLVVDAMSCPETLNVVLQRQVYYFG
jgi:hypothetical protein